jgi:hypothetical protein
MARLRLALGAALAAITLGGCIIGDGGALGHIRASCHLVDRAVADMDAAKHLGVDSPEGQALLQRASSLLSAATGPAAAGVSADGSWNALMTTLSEAARVPETNLEPALRRICGIAESNSPYLN